MLERQRPKLLVAMKALASLSFDASLQSLTFFHSFQFYP
jgi:hypothetical protein